MMRNWKHCGIGIWMGLGCVTTIHAFPLDTDDADTLGQGHGKMELNMEHTIEKHGVRETDTQTELALAYGVMDNLDLKFALPYRSIDAAGQASHNGVGDLSSAMKWRFHHRDDLAFALKWKWRMPTGDAGRGLGKGKSKHTFNFIASRKRDAWGYHVNAEYGRLGHNADMRTHQGRLSAGIQRQLGNQWKLMADLGVATPTKRAQSGMTLQIGVGVSYQLSRHLTADLGWKREFRDDATQYTGLAGLSMKF